MNKSIQHKIDQYRKMAKSQGNNGVSSNSGAERIDGLAQVIRSKKDADDFMAELKNVVKRAE